MWQILRVLTLASVSAGLAACGKQADPSPSLHQYAAPNLGAEVDTSAALIDLEVLSRLRILESKVEELETAKSILLDGLKYGPPGLDPVLVERLRNNTGITVQWVGWEQRGQLEVSVEPSGEVRLKGYQNKPLSEDFLRLEGQVVAMTPATFVLVGSIEMDIQHLRESGSPKCVREGAFIFRQTGERKYWRLLEKTGHCGSTTDYVDIYF